METFDSLLPRSFDQGKVELPDDTNSTLAERCAWHDEFDAAEKEILFLLAAGKVSAKGRKPAISHTGSYLQHAGPNVMDIPPAFFARSDIALDPKARSKLVLDYLRRCFPTKALEAAMPTRVYPSTTE